MGIGRDRKLDSHGLCRPHVDIVEVEAVRLGIEFHMAAALAGRLDDPLDIVLVRLALADQARGRVS